jgi:hypothetical protein
VLGRLEEIPRAATFFLFYVLHLVRGLAEVYKSGEGSRCLCLVQVKDGMTSSALVAFLNPGSSPRLSPGFVGYAATSPWTALSYEPRSRHVHRQISTLTEPPPRPLKENTKK